MVGLLLWPLSSQPGSTNSAETARLMQLPLHGSKREGRCSFKAALLTLPRPVHAASPWISGSLWPGQKIRHVSSLEQAVDLPCGLLRIHDARVTAPPPQLGGMRGAAP